ncbi:MAG: PepSY domain-containing protein, partial [Planctomycetota bacterium]
MDVKVKRLLWLWHFWAGLIATPVLLVMSITGGIYIFKDELESVCYSEVVGAGPNLLDQTNAGAVVDRAAAEAATTLGADWAPYGLEIETGRGRAPAFLAVSTDGSHRIRRLFFDPSTGKLRGEIPDGNFLEITLAIHRRLMAGTLGRILTELSTGWTILVSSLGLALWWPKKWRWKGVVVPRLRGKRYVVLRDLHSIGGVMVVLPVLLIAITGLLYTFVWGQAFNLAGLVTGQYDVVFNPPASTSPSDTHAATGQEIIDAMLRSDVPTARVSVVFAAIPTDPIRIEAGH